MLSVGLKDILSKRNIVYYSLLFLFYLSPVFSQKSIMILIEEKNFGSIATSEVEALATSLLLNEGYDVVDQEMVRTNVKKDQELLKMAGDTRGAAALGLQFGADWVLVGESVAKPSAKRIAGSNLRSYQAVVTLKVVRTEDSKTLTSASETSKTIGIEDISGSSKALKIAGKKAVLKILEQLRVAKSSGSLNSKKVQLVIGGVEQIWKLKSIRQALRGNSELSKVTQKSYTSGVAVFEITSSWNTERLSEHLVVNPPKGLRVQVLNMTPAKLNLKVVVGSTN